MSSVWKNLQNLASNKFLGVENKPGVYFIRWIKKENPVIINRLGGSDSTGLLYIGESKDLRRRFQRLWRGISRPRLLLALNAVINDSNRIKELYLAYPAEFKAQDFSKWQKRKDRIFKKYYKRLEKRISPDI